jgi:ankyrin repeat protein
MNVEKHFKFFLLAMNRFQFHKYTQTGPTTMENADTTPSPKSLHRACEKKNMVKVGHLLARRNVDVMQRDQFQRSPLLIAVQKDCTAIVFQLLDKGGNDLDAKDTFGKSALLYAAENKNHTIVTQLMARQADPNVSDIRGRTPLMISSQKGDLCIVKRLLVDERVCLEQEDEDLCTALWYAASSGHDTVVDLLVERGASVFTMNLDRKTPLMIATINGHAKCVRLLLQRSTVNVNGTDRKGKTAVDYACEKQHVQIFKLLVEEGGAQTNIRCSQDGRTLLMRACKLGCKGIVDILLKMTTTANIDAMDIYRRTALYYACKHPDVFELLLKHGASTMHIDRMAKTVLMRSVEAGCVPVVQRLLSDAKDLEREDSDGYTALSYACLYGRGEMAKMLVLAGASPLVTDIGGRTPLMLASFYDHGDIVSLLLQSKDDTGVNRRDSQGMTALSKACFRGYSQIAHMLLAHGADAGIADQYLVTPLMYACRFSHNVIVKNMLELWDVDVNLQDDKSQTALYYACKHESIECVELLLSHHGNPCLSDEKGRTPLMLACRKGNNALVELFLRYMDGSGLNMQDECGQTAFFHACDAAHAETALLLLKKGADSTKVCNHYLISPLILACGSGDDVITAGILQGVGKFYVDFVDCRHMTALYHASSGGHLGCVRQLLTNHADVTVTTSSGMTALHESSSQGYLAIVKELVLSLPTTYSRRRAYVNMSDNDGTTSLHKASREGYLEIAEFLVEHGASLTAADDSGHTALIVACIRRRYAIVDMFLTKHTTTTTNVDVNVNQTNREGKTALYYAISNHDTELVKLLVRHGADIRILFENRIIWMTGYPHHLSLGFLRLLVDTFGIDVDATNLTGKTPLLLLALAYSNKTNAIQFFLSRRANPWLASPRGLLPIHAARTMNVHDLLENAMMEDQRFLLLEKARVLQHMETCMNTTGVKTRETRASKRQRWLPVAPKVLKERIEKRDPLPTIMLNDSSLSLETKVLKEIVENRMNDDVFRELYAMMKTPWE